MSNELVLHAFIIMILIGTISLICALVKIRHAREADQAGESDDSRGEEPIAEVAIDSQKDTYAEYRELRKLNPHPQYGEYIRFTNLVIESGYNTPYTEIDELIVSRFGIFCIEQKDYQGIVIGHKYDAKWMQYVHSYKGSFMNPNRQNYKHRKALEKLLAGKLHSNIHTYSYFPKAYKVKTDDKMTFTSRDELWSAIRSHTRAIYTFDEVSRIAKILAYESTRRENRMVIHVATLRSYLAMRPS